MSDGQALVNSIEDFTDDEIRREYEERDLAPPRVTISDFDDEALLTEAEDRDILLVPEPIADEVLDLIAEAARTSPHAARAYELIRAEEPQHLPRLEARQSLIAGRMGEVPA